MNISHFVELFVFIILSLRLRFIWAVIETANLHPHYRGLQNVPQTPGSCQESDIKNTEINKQIFELACKNKFGRPGDHMIKFHALLLPEPPLQNMAPGMGREPNDFNPNYAQIRQEARQNVISLAPDGVRWLNEHLLYVIKPGDKIYLVVHGYTDSLDSLHWINGVEWMLVVGAEWRHYGNGHVFLVDWQHHAATHYASAIYSHIYSVANVIQRFLEFLHAIIHYEDVTNLIAKKEFYNRVEAAGHSLGAQILGLVGYNLAKLLFMLGKIFGLDPAGYLLNTTFLQFSETKFLFLNKGCAIKVMTLITEPDQLGMDYIVGHYSFFVFVEFGKPDWCDNPDIELALTCKHQRATNIFRASMRRHANFDDQLIGFKAVRNKVIRDLPVLFGIHHVTPELGFYTRSNLEEGAYYLPIGECAPYNRILDKAHVTLPSGVTQTDLNINALMLFFNPIWVIKVKFQFNYDDDSYNPGYYLMPRH